MWTTGIISLCLLAVANADHIRKSAEDDLQRNSKLSIFQVVKFANSECSGSSKNGTCYTQAECDNLGGTSSGTCADGFGVCCIKSITPGESSSVNNTYITLSSDESSGSKQYTICPCSDDICRIKFDFIDFTLAGPITWEGTTTDIRGAVAAFERGVKNIGQCTTDQFQIVTPSGRSSPLICGENDNQHMILETCSDQCMTVNLGLGATTTTTRDLNIRVMQYRCGEESAGPPGCLQYYENTSGKIRSFNFPDVTPGSTISYNTAVHLANQHYKTCVRRANGYEVICYIPCTFVGGGIPDIAATDVTAQASFGVSGSVVDEATGSAVQIGTECSTDYIWIPFGLLSTQFTSAIAHQDKVPEAETTAQVMRFCGNGLGTASAVLDTEEAQTIASTAVPYYSLCSYVTPFELGVDFDDQEVCSANETPDECEALVESESKGGGGGILGFSLCYVQHVPPIS